MGRKTPEAIRKEVIALANGVCERCGEVEEFMDVHHRNTNWEDNSLENLDYLCKSCHTQVHVYLNRRKTARYKRKKSYTRKSTLYTDKLVLPTYQRGYKPKRRSDNGRVKPKRSKA